MKGGAIMDKKRINKLATMWEFSLRESSEDIAQEIFLLFYTFQSNDEKTDIFDVGNEGALFEKLKYIIKGNNIHSLGGSGKGLGGSVDNDDPEILIKDSTFSNEEYQDEIESRFNFENAFSNELEELDNLNYLSGNDLGKAFGFTDSNGRLVLADLKKKIISKAQKRFTSKMKPMNLHLNQESIQQKTGRA